MLILIFAITLYLLNCSTGTFVMAVTRYSLQKKRLLCGSNLKNLLTGSHVKNHGSMNKLS